MGCSSPGSSVHGILQTRILEWVVISSSRGSSDPGMEPVSLTLAGEVFTTEPLGKTSKEEIPMYYKGNRKKMCNIWCEFRYAFNVSLVKFFSLSVECPYSL